MQSRTCSPQSPYYPAVLCLLLLTVFSFRKIYAQAPPSTPAKAVVRGKVTDDKGRYLNGASIQLRLPGQLLVDTSASRKKINGKGVTTDANGNFSITVPDYEVTLVVSYVGYAIQEVPLKGRTTVNVILTPIANELSSVVMIGYGGETSKKNAVASYGKPNIEDMAKAPVKSFEDALAGRVAGVKVSSNDGQPGSSPNIAIRGTNSITQDNSPLYVIDGFPIENPDNNYINPSDIESIDILKDASATAIYGSRGANGVILITTKSGKRSEPKITYDGYVGFQQDFNRPKMMNPYDFVQFQLLNNPNAASLYLREGKTPESYKDVKGLDMQDLLLRRGIQTSHSLAMRGGSDRTTYSVSLNAFDQQGIIINSGFKRLQGRLKLEQTVNPNLKVGINVNYANTKTFGTFASGGATNPSVNIIYQMMGYRPVSGLNDAALIDSLYDPDINGNVAGADYRINPYLSARNELNQRIGNGLQAQGYLQYKFWSNFILRISGGIDNNWGRGEVFNNSFTQTGNPRYNVKGVNGSVTNSLLSNWLNENTLTFRKIFNQDHSLDVLAGFTAQKTTVRSHRLVASQVPNESMGIDGLDEGGTQTISSSSSRSTLASFLGRINYGLFSKYMFNFAIRSDGSSKFAPGNKWGVFPSGGFAWKLGDEKFMEKLLFLSEAKIRLTYGVTGNNRVSDFPYLSTFGLPINAAYSFNNGTPVNGVSLISLGSPDLTWETTEQFNAGLDVGFFHDRLSLSIDAYRKTTRDLLLYANLPYTTGFEAGYKNIGKMRNEGLEFTLNTINVENKNFKWTSSFNISFNKNKVLGLTDNQESLLNAVAWDANFGNPLYLARIGQPVAQFYGFIWDGVYQYDDFDAGPDGKYYLKNNVPTNGNVRANIKPGDIKYKDINGDLVVNNNDLTVIGRALPIHEGGLSNNFTYKGFSLNVFFQWTYGNKIFNANRLVFEGNGRGALNLNQFESYKGYWTPTNPSNTLHRPNGHGPLVYSTRTLEDGSFLRLKTVSLAYNAPAFILNALRVKGLRVSVSAQNLWTITGYSGRDPEVSTRNSTLTPGFDYSGYPIVRSMVAGITVDF